MDWNSQKRKEFWELAAWIQQQTASAEEKTRFFALRCDYFAYLMDRVIDGNFSSDESQDIGIMLSRLVDMIASEKFGRDGTEFLGEVWIKVTEKCRLIARKDNPWAYVWRLVFNLILDTLRGEIRRSSKIQNSDRNIENQDEHSWEHHPDTASLPDEEALFKDMEIQLSKMLRPHFNADHVGYFIEYFQGERIVDIAQSHKVTENAVQLAIRRIQEFLKPRWKR